MEADNGTTEQNQKIPFHVYNYYLSEKNGNQNKKEKSYYINKKDKETVLKKLYYTELKNYLEKENCPEKNSIENLYNSYIYNPYAISARRVFKMNFDENWNLSPFFSWSKDYQFEKIQNFLYLLFMEQVLYFLLIL